MGQKASYRRKGDSLLAYTTRLMPFLHENLPLAGHPPSEYGSSMRVENAQCLTLYYDIGKQKTSSESEA